MKRILHAINANIKIVRKQGFVIDLISIFAGKTLEASQREVKNHQVINMPELLAQCSENGKHADDVMAIAKWKSHVFSGAYDGTIKKWNEKLELVQTWQAHDEVVYCLVCDDNRLFSSSSYGEVKEWNPDSGEFRQMTILTNPMNKKATEVKSLCLQNGLLYGGDDGGNLVEWTEDFKPQKQKITYNEIWSVCASPDGQNVIIARDNECIINDVSIDFSREEFAQTVAVRGTIRGRAPVVVDEHHIICVDRGGMNVSIYAYDNAKFPSKASLKGGHDMIINSLLLSSDAVVSAGWDSKVVWWDLGNSEKPREEFHCPSYINILAWMNKEKKKVLAGGKNGYLVCIQFP